MTLTIQLSTDSTCDVKVLIELLQDQGEIDFDIVVLASQNATLTTTPTNYVLTADASKVVMGRCNLSELKVRVTPVEKCRCPYCPTVDLPDTIIADDGTHTVTLTWNGTAWHGTGTLVGCDPADCYLLCQSEAWYFAVNGAQYIGGATGTCDPLSLSCTATSACDSTSHTVTFSA